MAVRADALERIKEKAEETIALDALAIALSQHNPKGVNVVLLGVLSTMMDISEEAWLTVLKERVPAKFLESNLAVFAAGRKQGFLLSK